jgi:hypothetical protein
MGRRARIHSGAAVVGYPPLTVASQAGLQQRVYVLFQWKDLRQLIVNVQSLDWVYVGLFLSGVKLPHLVTGE